MKPPKFIALFAGIFFWMAPPTLAQTDDTGTSGQPNQNEVMTRAELVTDLDKIITNWERRSQNYVTKSEVAELRTLLTQIRDEMGSVGEREGRLQTETDEIEQRTDHTRRPGF